MAIYRIQLAGAQQVLMEMEGLDASVKGIAQNIAGSMQGTGVAVEGVEKKNIKLADAFKQVSRDVGTLGGQTGQAFSHMADEALSIIEVIGKGGLLGAIGGLSIAVGVVVSVWKVVKEEAERAAEAQKKAVESVKNEAKEITEVIKKMKGPISKEDVEGATATVDALKAMVQEEKNRIERIKERIVAHQMAVANATIEDHLMGRVITNELMVVQALQEEVTMRARLKEMNDQLAKAEEERAKAAARLRAQQKRDAEFEADNALFEQRKKVIEDSQKLAQDVARARGKREIDEAEATNNALLQLTVERVKKVAEREQSLIATSIDSEKQLIQFAKASDVEKKESALRRIADLEIGQKRAALSAFVYEQDLLIMSGLVSEEVGRKRIDDAKKELEDFKRIRAARLEVEIAGVGLEAQDAENKEAEASERKRREEIERTTKALKEKAAADALAARETNMASAVNAAYGASVMVVTPIVGAFTDQLQKLGEVNRDNFEEMRKNVDDLPAIIAKEAQTIAAGIAVQAATKAAMEMGEAAKETALGIGMTAIGSPTASLHFQSAGIHVGAASLYAGLAGGFGAGAFAIGMSRGEGGIVGLTKEEKEANERKKEKEAGRGGGGPSGGRMTGGGGDDTTAVYNFNYYPGSVALHDEKQGARRVTRMLALNNRDGFARRERANG